MLAFVDVGGLVDHHCLEVIVGSVDVGGLVDHHCIEAIVGFVDVGGLVDHHCIEVIVGPSLMFNKDERWLFMLLMLVDLLTISV